MFDPLNRITCHALIGPKSVGERDMAANHFANLNERDLVLLDRGYPAFWLFKLILSRNAQFCARISDKKWKIIRRFIKSGKAEQIVFIDAPVTSLGACQARHLDTLPLQLRLLRIELDSGETEVLITSLTDFTEYPHALFAQLYHERWGVEEDYKIMKCRIEIENFTGKSVLSVYQDFHSAVFSKNIAAMLVFAVRDKVAQETKQRQYGYKANFTQALSTIRDSIVLLFQGTKRIVLDVISDILATLAKAVEPVRPGRKYQRNHKRSQRKNSLCYKPTL